MEVGLSPGDFVFDGDPAAPEKKGTTPTEFLAQVYCGQTAGWIKMPLGMEVNLGSGNIVRWGCSFPRKVHSPQFSVHVHCGQTAGWMKTLLCTEVDLGPDREAAPRERGTANPPSILAMVAHLSCR